MGKLQAWSLGKPPKVTAETFLQNPLIRDQLLSRDGRTMLMPVIFKDHRRQTIDAASALARESLEKAGLRVRLTGVVPLFHAYRKAFEQDHKRIQLIGYVLVFVLAMIIFRRPSAIAIACSGSVLGVLWTLGLLNLLGEPRNDLSDIILPVMLMMVGFTDGVHLVVHLRRERAAGLGAVEAARATVKQVGAACFLTSLTTAIGFGSLMVSDSEIIRSFGRAAALGVMFTFVAVICVIPLLSVSWVGRRLHAGLERDLVGRNMRRLTWLVDFVLARPKLVASFGVVLTLALTLLALRLQPDDRLRDRIPHSAEAWQALDHCDREFGGVRYVQAVVEWPERARPSQIWNVIKQSEQLLTEEPLIRGAMSIRLWLSALPGGDTWLKLPLAYGVPPDVRRQFWRPEQRRALSWAACKTWASCVTNRSCGGCSANWPTSAAAIRVFASNWRANRCSRERSFATSPAIWPRAWRPRRESSCSC